MTTNFSGYIMPIIKIYLKINFIKILKGGTIMSEKSVVERIIERAEKEKKLVSNYDYISWLENFTLKHESFNDSSWLYNSEEISKEDLANVEDLCAFFDGIRNYCDKYYINTESSESFVQGCIHIKHHNVGYEIGLVVGQGAYVYVAREEPVSEAIEFCHVVNNTKPENFETKEKILKKLDFKICEAKDIGIPEKCITDIVEKYFKR